MPLLRIPDEYRTGLAKIAAVPDGTADELIAALRSTPPLLTAKRIASRVAPLVPSITLVDLEEVVDTLLSLYAVRKSRDLSVEQFADDVCAGMQSVANGQRALTGDLAGVLGERIARLLSIESLGVASKAWGLQLEQASTFDSCRVLTDVRPVFGDSPELPAKGALIVHTLKIMYWQDADLKSFYVAMDTDDLQELQEVLKRADLKARTLKAALAQASISELE